MTYLAGSVAAQVVRRGVLQHIPQSCTVVVLSVAFKCLEERLVDVELRGNSNAMPAQLPGDYHTLVVYAVNQNLDHETYHQIARMQQCKAHEHRRPSGTLRTWKTTPVTETRHSICRMYQLGSGYAVR